MFQRAVAVTMVIAATALASESVHKGLVIDGGAIGGVESDNMNDPNSSGTPDLEVQGGPSLGTDSPAAATVQESTMEENHEGNLPAAQVYEEPEAVAVGGVPSAVEEALQPHPQEEFLQPRQAPELPPPAVDRDFTPSNVEATHAMMESPAVMGSAAENGGATGMPATPAARPIDNSGIVFAVPTMRRWARDGTPAPEQYLTPLIEGIILDMTEEQHKRVRFILYNADKQPEKHAEVHQLKAKYPDLITVFTKPKDHHQSLGDDNDIVQLEKSSGEVHEMSMGYFNWIAGETKDATNLLFEARKLAPYVVFLEDDVKPTSGVITKLYDYMNEMQARGKNNWFMIDLYTPRINWGRNPLFVNNFERYDYECCTQAMLFRSDRLLDLLMYEASNPNMPIDDNIRDYSRESPDTREVYAIVPNLFEHVGRYSSNPEKSSETVEHQSINFVP